MHRNVENLTFSILAMRIFLQEVFPYNSISFTSDTFQQLYEHYKFVFLYTSALVALDLCHMKYGWNVEPQLHPLLCATLALVGTACVFQCCHLSWRLLLTRREWRSLWRKQARIHGVRFVVLAATAPLAFGLLALYCLWRHGQHMAEGEEEEGSRWHGTLLSIALTAPRVVREFINTLLVTQVLPATRIWVSDLTANQKQAVMTLMWWQILASVHNFTLAVLHVSHAHFVGLYPSKPEYLLLVYNGLLLTWACTILVLVASSVPTQIMLQGTTRVLADELVPGTDMAIDLNSYPPPLIGMVGGASLINVPPRLRIADGPSEGIDPGNLPPHIKDRVRRHSYTQLHKHFRFHHRELT